MLKTDNSGSLKWTESWEDRFEDEFVEVYMDTAQWKPSAKHFPNRVRDFIHQERKALLESIKEELKEKSMFKELALEDAIVIINKYLTTQH